MKHIFLYTIIILSGFFSLKSEAAFDEQQCFCQDPKDCEVGTVTCSYKMSYNGKSRTGLLIGKFIAGDDPSPEVGAQARSVNYDQYTYDNNAFFASTCSTKYFGVTFWSWIVRYKSADDWQQLGDLKTTFVDIPFNEKPVTKKIESTDGKHTLEVSCSGGPNK